VRILPESPTVESELHLLVEGSHQGEDAVTFRTQWIRNDQEVPFEEKANLARGRFRKGDLIRARVIRTEARPGDEGVLSAPVRILNSAPVLQSVEIHPSTPLSSDSLKVVTKGVDADGDPIYYRFQWELNGSPLDEEKEETLGRGRFKKGDSLTVVVTPNDGEASGSPKRSAAVVISNSPPVISSTPPDTVAAGNQYRYSVRAEDPDGDPVSYRLKAGPKGMEIDPGTGVVRWEFRKEDRGAHSVEIEAYDPGGGRSVQRYTLRLDFK
jgi:hypothetical protein